jgi:hypothetical protein
MKVLGKAVVGYFFGAFTPEDASLPALERVP